MKLYFTAISSPLGALHLVGTELGLSGLYMESERHSAAVPLDAVEDDAFFSEPKKQLDAYFAGDLAEFSVKLDLRGTPFQQRCWAALCEIPYGETRSYQQQASAIQNEKAVRAVGLANGKNPISIIVPCHRVIGKSGRLTGYGGGIERKQFLLDLEKRYAAKWQQTSALGRVTRE